MFLDNYIKKISDLCIKHKVKNMSVFGSVLSDSFSLDSDIDLIVEINSNDPIEYAENYFMLKFELEDLLQRRVDLLEKKGLKNNHLIERINKTKKVIYEA